MTLYLRFVSIFLISLSVLGGKSETTFSPRVKKTEALYLPKGSWLIAECLKPEIDLSKMQFLTPEDVMTRFMPISQEEVEAQKLSRKPLSKEITGTKSKKRKKILRLHRQKSLEEIAPLDSPNAIKLASYWDESSIPIGATPLHIAVIRNEVGLIAVLLTAGGYEQILTQDEDNNTPLHLAIKVDHEPFNAIINGSLDKSEQNLYQTYLIESLTKFNDKGYAVLHLALSSSENSQKYVSKLLEMGANPNLFTREQRPKTPIEIALRKEKYYEAIQLMLAGAGPPQSKELFQAELVLLERKISQEKREITEWLKMQKRVGPGFLEFYKKGKKFSAILTKPIKTDKPGHKVQFRYEPQYGAPIGPRTTVKSLPSGGHTLIKDEQTAVEEE